MSSPSQHPITRSSVLFHRLGDHGASLLAGDLKLQKRWKSDIPSRQLTYPTWGKGNHLQDSKVSLNGKCLFPVGCNDLPGCLFWWEASRQIRVWFSKEIQDFLDDIGGWVEQKEVFCLPGWSQLTWLFLRAYSTKPQPYCWWLKSGQPDVTSWGW